MQSVQDLATAVQQVINNVEKVIVGKAESVAFSLIAVICNGHVLIEDVPGVGKTALALALAHDREVLGHFCDGVLWAGLGRESNVFSFLGAWGVALGIPQPEIEKQLLNRDISHNDE